MKRVILLVISCFLLFTLIGCEAFVRKFTRKPKRQELPLQEMVLEPQEYSLPQMSKDEKYRRYFLFWKSWHDEIINSLSSHANHKKQIDCANEAIKNLTDLKALLSEDKQEELDIYLEELNNLWNLITEDIYGRNIAGNRQSAERLKRKILRDFSYNKVKDDLR